MLTYAVRDADERASRVLGRALERVPPPVRLVGSSGDTQSCRYGRLQARECQGDALCRCPKDLPDRERAKRAGMSEPPQALPNSRSMIPARRCEAPKNGTTVAICAPRIGSE